MYGITFYAEKCLSKKSKQFLRTNLSLKILPLLISFRIFVASKSYINQYVKICLLKLLCWLSKCPIRVM